MRGLIGLWLFTLATITYANVAINQLHGLLAHKEGRWLHNGATSSMLKDLQKNFYFVFIYRSTCPHCHNFAPILKDFATHFHVKVKSYSLDNQPIDGFNAAKLTPNLFQALYVAGGFKPAVPALFLVNRETLQAYAVLFGEATPYELSSRVNELMTHIEEQFHD